MLHAARPTVRVLADKAYDRLAATYLATACISAIVAYWL
jgi:hypothetical protein